LVRVGKALGFDPRSFVESDSVHDQRVAVPAPDGMSGVCGLEIFRMRASIHIDDAETVRPADIEDEHPLKVTHLDKLEPVRRTDLARAGRRFASRMRRIAFEVR